MPIKKFRFKLKFGLTGVTKNKGEGIGYHNLYFQAFFSTGTFSTKEGDRLPHFQVWKFSYENSLIYTLFMLCVTVKHVQFTYVNEWKQMSP